VVSDGACPSAAEVVRELAHLLPAVALEAVRDGATPDDAVVRERSSGVSVAMSGQERFFEGADRSCSERAQLAAVFIAIVVDPPRFPVEPAPDRFVGPPVAPPEPPTPRSRRHIDFELGPSTQVAPASGLGATPLAFGFGARGVWGGDLSVSAGVSGLSSTLLRYPGADARMLLVPFDLGARLGRSMQAWDAGAELSFVLAAMHIQGEGMSMTESAWRLLPGGRAAVFARVWTTPHVGLSLSVYSTLFPFRYTVGVGGIGSVGETPVLWPGVQLNVVVRAE